MALVSSAGSNSETTSNEYSATARAEDRVESQDDRDDRKRDARHRRDRKQRSDPGSSFVERLDGRLVVRVWAIVEVVDALLPRALDQLVEHRSATWWEGLALEVGDRLL